MLFILFYSVLPFFAFYCRLRYFECGSCGCSSQLFFIRLYLSSSLYFCCVIYSVAVSFYSMIFWISSADIGSKEHQLWSMPKGICFLRFFFFFFFFHIRAFVAFIGNGYQMNRLNVDFHSNVIWMSIKALNKYSQMECIDSFSSQCEKKSPSIKEWQNKMKNSEYNNWIIIASPLSSFYRFTSHETKPKRQWQKWQTEKKTESADKIVCRRIELPHRSYIFE